jgi:hypothetical protein
MNDRHDLRPEPSLEEVIQCVRDSSGDRKTAIDEHTWLEKDLGITGDDGSELIEEAELRFGVSLFDEEGNAFGLKENEYLFTAEGLDLLGICQFIDWLRGIPRSVITDLNVGQLHQALVRACRKRDMEG